MPGQWARVYNLCDGNMHGCIISVLGTGHSSGEDEKPLIGEALGTWRQQQPGRELIQSLLMCDGSLDTASWSPLLSDRGKQSRKLFIVLVLLHISLILSCAYDNIGLCHRYPEFAICHISVICCAAETCSGM